MDGPLLFSVDDVAYRVLGGRNYGFTFLRRPPGASCSTTGAEGAEWLRGPRVWRPWDGFYAPPVKETRRPE